MPAKIGETSLKITFDHTPKMLRKEISEIKTEHPTLLQFLYKEKEIKNAL